MPKLFFNINCFVVPTISQTNIAIAVSDALTEKINIHTKLRDRSKEEESGSGLTEINEL